MERRLVTVDTLRGLAALSVAWFHLTSQSVPSAGSLGWLGLDVFFVISGFVVPLSLFGRDYRLSGFGHFLTRRLVRLEPPYLASIALVIALAALSALAPGFRGAEPHYTLAQITSHLFYLAPLLGQDWILPVYWTLAYELAFYICVGLTFPLLIKRSILWLAPIALASQAPHYLLTGAPDPLALEFLVGFAAMRFYVGRDKLVVFLATLAVVAMAILVMGSPLRAAAAPIAALVIVFITTPRWRVLGFLGAISYSLYLVHLPLGGRVVNLGMRLAEGPVQGLAVSVIAIVVSLVGAYVFHRMIERPAVGWSRMIKVQMTSKPVSGHAAPAAVAED